MPLGNSTNGEQYQRTLSRALESVGLTHVGSVGSITLVRLLLQHLFVCDAHTATRGGE